MGESTSDAEDGEVVEEIQSEDENSYVTEEVPLQGPAVTEEPPVADSDSIIANVRRKYHIWENTLRRKNGHIWLNNKNRSNEG